MPFIQQATTLFWYLIPYITCMGKRKTFRTRYSHAVKSVTSSDTTKPSELVPLQTKVPSSASNTNLKRSVPLGYTTTLPSALSVKSSPFFCQVITGVGSPRISQVKVTRLLRGTIWLDGAWLMYG